MKNQLPRDVEEPSKKYNPSNINPTYFESYSEHFPHIGFLTEESDSIRELTEIHHLIYGLCHHKFELPFKKGSHYGKPRLEITPLGQTLLRFLRKFPELKSNFPHHDLQPMTMEAIRLAEDFRPTVSPDDVRHACGEEIDTVIIEYSDWATQMRQIALSNGMHERVKSFRRNGTRNYKQLMAVMKQRQEQHKEILFCRLDYSPRKKDPLIPVERMSHCEFLKAFREVSQARKLMTKHLRKTFKKDLLLYAWKIEWGPLKGLHIHWIIGLNGSKYQDRINVPLHIAKDWDLLLFKSQSHTHNVNALATREAVGLKVVHYADPNAGYYFGHHADYLTKVDYTMRLRLPRGLHAFGCTKLKKPSKNKTGPKRFYEMQAYNVHAVRGPQGGKAR